MCLQRSGRAIVTPVSGVVTQKRKSLQHIRRSMLGSHLGESLFFSSESLYSLQEKRKPQLREGTKVSNSKVTIAKEKSLTMGISKTLVCFLNACSLNEHIQSYLKRTPANKKYSFPVFPILPYHLYQITIVCLSSLLTPRSLHTCCNALPLTEEINRIKVSGRQNVTMIFQLSGRHLKIHDN